MLPTERVRFQTKHAVCEKANSAAEYNGWDASLAFEVSGAAPAKWATIQVTTIYVAAGEISAPTAVGQSTSTSTKTLLVTTTKIIPTTTGVATAKVFGSLSFKAAGLTADQVEKATASSLAAELKLDQSFLKVEATSSRRLASNQTKKTKTWNVNFTALVPVARKAAFAG